MSNKKSYNIGYDAKRAFFNNTGLGNYSRTLLNQIIDAKKEDTIYLFTPKEPKDYYGLNQENVRIVWAEGFWNKLLKSFWRSVWLGRTLKKHQIDLYHGLSQELPMDISKADCATVVTMHDLIFLRYKEGYNPIDIRTYRKKAKFACDNADHIIAISEQTKQDLIDFLNIPKEKITVVYQDCSEFYKIPATEKEKIEVKKKYNLPEHFVLSVGTSNFRKNNKTLIEAISKTEKNIPLVIVGNGDEKQSLVSLVKEKGLENKVSFLGFVPDEDLKPIYALADLYIYPSLFEGFGIPILEALYANTPVITGKTGCFSEVGGDFAMYVNQTDSTEMAKAIDFLFLNKEKQTELLNGVEQHLKKFTHKQTFPQIENIYNSVLGNNSSEKKAKLSALLICYNEKKNIREYLNDFSFADEIIVVDSFSNDGTVEIIKNEYPHVKLHQRKFDNYTAQRNYTISLATNEWATFFDADERINDKLKKEIIDTINNPNSKDAYFIKRNFHFKNKHIKHSGWKNDKAVRLFKVSKVRFDEKYLVHEQITPQKDIDTLKNPLFHYSLTDEKDYEIKLDNYAKLRAKELYKKGVKPSIFKREIKAKYRFFKHYILQLGFLDGKEGYIISKIYESYVRKRYIYLAELYKQNGK